MRAFLRSYANAKEEVGYVIVENEDGARWSHDVPFYKKDILIAEFFVDKVQAVLDVKGMDGLDMVHWTSIDPAYGSEAHEKIGDYHLMDDDDIEAMNQALR